MGRLPVTLVAAGGGVIAGVAAQAGSSAVASVAWAVLAGLGLSLMLHGRSLRVVGVFLVLLSGGGIVWAATAGQWASLVGFAVAVIGSLGFVVWGPTWVRRTRVQDAPEDLWKAMDSGDDLTNEQLPPDNSRKG